MVTKYCASAENKAFAQYLRYGTPMNVPYFLIKAQYSFYIWRTQEDAKVRESHRANHGKIFEWAKPPPTMHPGFAPNCRCWAEAVYASFPEGMEDSIRLNDVTTWPTVPIDGPLKTGLPTRAKERRNGELRLYDQYGGEWRPHTDPRHNLHWDYKAQGKCSEWLNIPINNKPTKKGLYLC